MNAPEQLPPAGEKLVRHRGDALVFALTLAEAAEGTAFLRTSLGSARTQRREIIRHVEEGAPRLSRGWRDLPMRRMGDRRFEIEVPLVEVGRFHAKAFFVPDGREEKPLWPEGEDTLVKRPITIPFDMVVHAIGMDPNIDNPEIAQVFGVDLEEHGHIGAANRYGAMGETSRAGVFVAGAATGPETIDDSIAQGHAAAMSVLSGLKDAVA